MKSNLLKTIIASVIAAAFVVNFAMAADQLKGAEKLTQRAKASACCAATEKCAMKCPALKEACGSCNTAASGKCEATTDKKAAAGNCCGAAKAAPAACCAKAS